MKAHELATALKVLSNILKNGPNLEIKELPYFGLPPRNEKIPTHTSKSNADLPIALSALLSLSRIDKQEWIALISDLGLDIDVRPRDASRDVVGKVLRLLEKDPEARDRLGRKVHSRESNASPELARALSSLLNG